MRYFVTVLVVALVVVGLWGADSPAIAQSDCVSQGAVPSNETALDADCEILLSVRDTLAGSDTLDWAADTSIERWEGISVGGVPRRVVSIRLIARGLNGTLPVELGDLASLMELDLGENQLTGTVPSELGQLSGLTQLWLNSNELTGAIPAQLGNLPNLEILAISSNQLTGIIPEELGNLSNLKVLWLHANDLTSTIPARLGNLSSLEHLALSSNHLMGPIPSELGNLSNLRRLRLGNNEMTREIPAELGNLSNLEELFLSFNSLTGTIPSELGNLSSLTGLWLHTNELTGPIPAQLGNLSNLEYLELGNNGLSGSIPTELGGLSNLTFMNLSSNRLSGEIPTEFGYLHNLEELSLSRNQLTGTIPSELGNLSNLTGLWLADNRLTGQIPRSFTSLARLTTFYFWNNSGLCAPTDDEFREWLQAVEHVLGHSCDFVTDRDVLVTLYNATDGTNWRENTNWLSDLPLGGWTGVDTDDKGRVTRLDLEGIRLSGQVPDELGRLSNLTWINLSHNQLYGEVPPQFGNLSELAGLYLRNNRFTGSIPPQLGNLHKLRGLQIADNQFTGCIPAELRDVRDNDFDEMDLPFCAPLWPGVPTVSVIRTTPTTVRTNSVIPLAVVFSEPVNGFTVDDVSVTNAVATDFATLNGSFGYSLVVIPNAIGEVTVDIAAGVAEDYEGNGNTAAVQLILGLPYDDDGNGAIGPSEVLEAVRDYFSGRLSAQHILELIGLYFQAPG